MNIDRENITSFIEGNIDSFELIYKETSDFVYRVVFKMVHSRQEAEDLTQDIFIKIFEKREKFNNRSSLKTWIYRLATNYTLTYLKKKNSFINKIFKYESTVYVDDDIENDEEIKIINKLLDKINPDYRICLLLKENEKMNYEEISNVLDIKIGTVRSRINRAKQQLITLYRKEIN